jgi:hypothetical protein
MGDIESENLWPGKNKIEYQNIRLILPQFVILKTPVMHSLAPHKKLLKNLLVWYIRSYRRWNYGHIKN